MNKRIPDPVEIRESKIESLVANYVNESTCMNCDKVVDYDLICPSPIGDGPAVCVEYLGLSPEEELKYFGAKIEESTNET